MLTLFLSLTALTAMGMFWFSRKREDYEFLTVDSATGDLTIVDSSSGLEALEGGLQTTGNFNVKGALTTDGTINGATITSGGVNGATITSGGVNGVTIGSSKVNGVTLSNNTVNADEITGTHHLCIGDTCINQNHLKMLTGENNVFLTANSGAGKLMISGDYINGHTTVYSTAQEETHAKWKLKGSYP